MATTMEDMENEMRDSVSGTGSLVTCDDDAEQGMVKPKDVYGGGSAAAAAGTKCLAQESYKQDSIAATRWKLIVLLAIAINGLVIVIATYSFLLDQENTNFKSAVSTTHDGLGWAGLDYSRLGVFFLFLYTLYLSNAYLHTCCVDHSSTPWARRSQMPRISTLLICKGPFIRLGTR